MADTDPRYDYEREAREIASAISRRGYTVESCCGAVKVRPRVFAAFIAGYGRYKATSDAVIAAFRARLAEGDRGRPLPFKELGSDGGGVDDIWCMLLGCTDPAMSSRAAFRAIWEAIWSASAPCGAHSEAREELLLTMAADAHLEIGPPAPGRLPKCMGLQERNFIIVQ